MQQPIVATVRPEISVVLEDAGGNWGAYVPGIPGVIATGATPEACRQSIEEALAFHLHGLAEDDTETPLPSEAKEAAR